MYSTTHALFFPKCVEAGGYCSQYLTSCARGDTICPRPSPPSVGAEAPHAAEPTKHSSRFPLWPLQLPNALTRRWVKRPGEIDLWPFDPESGVRVTCDVGYLDANFDLPRPLCSRLRPDVRDRRQTDRCQTSDRRQTSDRQTSDKSIA